MASRIICEICVKVKAYLNIQIRKNYFDLDYVNIIKSELTQFCDVIKGSPVDRDFQSEVLSFRRICKSRMSNRQVESNWRLALFGATWKKKFKRLHFSMLNFPLFQQLYKVSRKICAGCGY